MARNMASQILLYNQGGQLLARLQPCRSWGCRGRGLMFRRPLQESDGLFFVFPRSGRWETAIHMFFVFFPIAAIWLDEAGRIVHAVEARPFRVYIPPRPARYLVEGPVNLLTHARIGEVWIWREDAGGC
ncbi:MAG: DUF192 domain-containing protein [Anaerolineae bacterium]|uniref:DUF192 domain-containing protein n=2 Tax=Thermoflexus sp. TaxID=1969742 RepID=UPI0025F52693|nr:DUF192 domain-containing protein [Thermoflexus sp.]MCS7351341.1 DUF192 domain-containing protein [Thermoflexus sp.]MDW8180796.1 DUF192 domain-containing protein [Anaerolineae bacterium]